MTENFKKIIGDLEEEIKELKDEHGWNLMECLV